MSKIRINELARQLEVKSREVIEKLQELGIAEKTIKIHRARVMKKMKARSLADLIHFADKVRAGRPAYAPHVRH